MGPKPQGQGKPNVVPPGSTSSGAPSTGNLNYASGTTNNPSFDTAGNNLNTRTASSNNTPTTQSTQSSQPSSDANVLVLFDYFVCIACKKQAASTGIETVELPPTFFQCLSCNNLYHRYVPFFLGNTTIASTSVLKSAEIVMLDSKKTFQPTYHQP